MAVSNSLERVLLMLYKSQPEEKKVPGFQMKACNWQGGIGWEGGVLSDYLQRLTVVLPQLLSPEDLDLHLS